MSHGQDAQTLIDDEDITITVLTTNAADTEVLTQGEWSFSAWVEIGERAFLFDTGWSPGNVLFNADAMGIDLSVAEDVILSHNHIDHTGGLETLRRELSSRNPLAISRIHVAKGIFASRPEPDGEELNTMIALRERLEALGSTFYVYEKPTEIAPGVWVTGPVPRLHDERNYDMSPESLVVLDDIAVPDFIPEDQSLIITGVSGPVIVSGCGHSGLINTLEYANDAISSLPPQAAIGGYHLFAASSATISWTAEHLANLQLRHFVGSHCTGFEPVYTLRELLGVGKDQVIVGTIGTRYEGASGIVPGDLNR